MDIVRMKLDQLHSPAKNIRRHTEKQLEEYIRSVKMFGQVKPIICDEEGEIIAGNGLFETLKRIGETEADCVVMSGLSSKQKKKLMLADNKVYELGFTSLDDFEDILKDMDGDFDIPGYDNDLLSSIMAPVEEIVLGYGSERPTVTEPTEDEVVEYHSINQAQYAPPQRDETGGFVNPDAPKESPKENSQVEITASDDRGQDYIICPYCGEKIWL